MANFSVHGDFVTNVVRNMVLEDNSDRAWATLEGSLLTDDGSVPHDAIVSILNGSAKLEGVNDIMLVDEEDTAYKKNLEACYAGRIQFRGMWYSPSYIVSSYTQEAHASSLKYPQLEYAVCEDREVLFPDGDENWLEEWEELIAAWHVEEMRGHVIARKVLGFWVLWDVCGAPPFWMKKTTRFFEDAFTDFVEHSGRHVSLLDDVEIQKRIEEDDEPFSNSMVFRAQDMRRRRSAQRHRNELRVLRDRIMEQAGDDVLTLVIHGEEHTVPRAPFIHWALRRTKFYHLAPDWNVISPPEMKMAGDCRYHTDWLIGAGISLDLAYNKNILMPATDLAAQVQEKLCGTEAYVLAGVSGSHHGIVGESIIVLPHLGVEYASVVMSKAVKVIIAEEGGALSHLAVVGREAGLCILRVKNAVSMFKEGSCLSVNCETGRIVPLDPREK